MREGTLTDSQAARRERMLEAAVHLAEGGGWDAVQMREVAARAGVALGTLYRYFPSKEHLLLSVMLQQVEGLAQQLAVHPADGDNPADRVLDVLSRANRNLQRQPHVATAMIRALVSGNTEVAPVVGAVRVAMRRIITDAMGVEGQQGVMAADLLADLWLAALVSWITGVEDADSVVPRLTVAVGFILD